MVTFCSFDCLLTVFDNWYTVGTVLVDTWRLVHQWSFLLFWLSFDCIWRMVHCTNRWKTLKTTGVPIVTGLPRLYQQCTNRQKQSKDSQNSKNDHWCTNRYMSTKTVPTVYQQCIIKNSQKQSTDSQKSKKWPLVYQSSHVYQNCTNCVPTMYQSSKTVKNSQNSKNDHWCTEYTKSASASVVRVRQIHKAVCAWSCCHLANGIKHVPVY